MHPPKLKVDNTSTAFTATGDWQTSNINGLVEEALAIVHFIRRRPDTYWLFIIIFLGPLGALIYLAVEVLPDLGLLRTELRVFPRRRRIRELEALVRDNPSPGNYEELADLYFQDSNFRRCRECYDRSISARTGFSTCPR